MDSYRSVKGKNAAAVPLELTAPKCANRYDLVDQCVQVRGDEGGGGVMQSNVWRMHVVRSLF